MKARGINIKPFFVGLLSVIALLFGRKLVGCKIAGLVLKLLAKCQPTQYFPVLVLLNIYINVCFSPTIRKQNNVQLIIIE